MPEWLAQRARLTPDRIAVVCGSQRLTFRDLDQQVAARAGGLRALGVQPGDPVAVRCGNGIPFALLAHAVPRAGGVLVPLNTRLTASEIAFQLADVGARFLIHDGAHEESAPADGRVLRVRADEIPAGGGLAGSEVDLERTHSVIYTSGTTGQPKGAMLTFGNLWHSAAASAINLGHDPADRWLAPLPLFHVGGLSILLRSVIGGITAVILPRFDAAAVNRALDAEGITIVSVVSAMLRHMLDGRDRPYPSWLRCVLLGGGPVPPDLVERCLSLGMPVAPSYGLTETASQAVTLPPDEVAARPGSSGKPLMTAELRIERDGRSMPAGESGEIVLRGPTVTPGYINRPEATAEALRGGWLHTGDIGYLDADGYLYVLDRRQDLIVSGGENVYPAEVEAVLAAHPAVLEAGVVGVPDEVWGQVVAAVIVPSPGVQVNDEEILAFCRTRVAGYKVPRVLRRTETLPRNAGGKLMRQSLRGLFGR